MARYEPLTAYLKARQGDMLRLSFADIERIIGRKLPGSATTHRAWWSNNPDNNVMTRAWLEAGYQSEQVDLHGRQLVFRRVPEGLNVNGFEEAQGPFVTAPGVAADKLALFGWQQGTVTLAPGVDLCDPADPEWADVVETQHAPAA